MPEPTENRPGLELTNRGLRRDGAAWFPLSGELHYFRVPPSRWRRRLEQMRAGGLDVVASYVPWNYHEREQGKFDFSGHLNLAAFLDEVRDAGLDMVLRIGPWVHAEIRYGGTPDWVIAEDLVDRSDDPRYLAHVRNWWEALFTAVDGRCIPDRILAIQLDNELTDRPEHLATLKKMAREIGLTAPLWTATGWGHAQLPIPEVFPLFGGYSDGFWVPSDCGWLPTFRDHFFFSHRWDDIGIGADLREHTADTAGATGLGLYPPATCELGGGMATAYHRRPWPRGLDIAASANTKLGNGSTWQGYYMYVGGANPEPGLQESHATGYPNDMPLWDYDFHAPIGAAGRLSDTHATLRNQHAFARAFADHLYDMPSHLPDVTVSDHADSESLRWAVRGNDTAGFVFLNRHQLYEPLPDSAPTQLCIRFADREQLVPAKPIVIPAGTVARWPIGLTLGGVLLHYSTATALTLLDPTTLVVVAEAGITPEISYQQGNTAAVTSVRLSGAPAVVELKSDTGAATIVVIPAECADQIWVEPSRSNPRVVLCADEVTWCPGSRIEVRGMEPPHVLAWDHQRHTFRPLQLTPVSGNAYQQEISIVQTRAHGAITVRTGERATAPVPEEISATAAIFELGLGEVEINEDSCLTIEWAGDVAHLVIDGVAVADRFWDGSPWLINAHDLGIVASRRVEIHVVGLDPDTAIFVAESAQRRRESTDGVLCAVDRVSVQSRARFGEIG